MTTTRRLAAILAADVAGYSRLMAADEVGTLAALKAARREVVDPAIAEHNGRIVKTTGDGMLVDFASAVDAVTCAMVLQEKMARRGGNIAFRIGINVGDIIIDGDDIFGDGVNVAARVENECEPGRVYLSAQALDQVRAKTPFSFEDLGEKQLKNIDRPVRVYAVGIAASGTTTTALPEPGAPLALPDKPSIAVLPFQNMSGDPEQEYFADGMVEDIITALSRFNSLFVIARNSSFTYKGKAVDIKQVGQELGVRYVLEGSVRKAGSRVRITGQLIEAATGSHLWASNFDGALEDIFDLQDQVTARVVYAVAPSVERAEIKRAMTKATDHLGAYDWFMRGRAILKPTVLETGKAALEYFRRAISLDPTYARAYARAAYCIQLQRTYLRAVDEQVFSDGITFAEQAVLHGQLDAEALSYAAFFLALIKRELERADKIIDQAISLNPNYASAQFIRGWISVWIGRPETAIGQLEKAIRLSPMDADLTGLYSAMGAAHNFSGQPQEATTWLSKALARNPNQLPALLNMVIASIALGRTEEAQRCVERMKGLAPKASISSVADFVAFQRPEDLELLFRSLRAAGLPE